MACSSVILEKPPLVWLIWPSAADPKSAQAGKKNLRCSVMRLYVTGRLRVGKYVAVPGDPGVKRRKQNYAHKQGRNQAADDHDGKRPLRIRADFMGKGSW